MIKIGARGSQLSTAQVELVRGKLQDNLSLETEFITIKSHGDVNTSSPISKIQNEGAFTSTLESALLLNEIDVAVHSFKDLPTTNPEELEIVAVFKRHNPSDTLLIHKEKVKFIDSNNFILEKGTRIGTGSARRQTQFLHYFEDIATIDIRGNVDTRLKKLEKRQYDGIVMATAVFERINLGIPPDCLKIELDTQKFPTAPAQGAICLQMRKDHPLFSKIAEIDDLESRSAVELERKILKDIGGGCQLPLGVTIFKGKTKSNWFVNLTLAPQNWRDYATIPLTKVYMKEDSLEDIESQIGFLLPKNEQTQPVNLQDKEILLVGNQVTTAKYNDYLSTNGAITTSVDLQEILVNYSKELYENNSEQWLQADWVIITSKNAIPALRLFNKYHFKSNLKLASIGFSTTKQLQKNGFAVHFQAEESNAESLANGMKILVSKEEKLLFLSSSNAKITLKQIFETEGYHFRQIEVYSNSERQNIPFLFQNHSFDFVIVFSPEYARLAIDGYGSDLAKVWISVGPSTTQKLKELGIQNYKQLKNISIKELAEILV